ncbi:Hypp4622 [Branchiostoma lanceolatum]|uniref:Hypp4622 protein n=1 Tax=Branchiostoma lanceolatum TaxID=7740 RepID=A0A8K0AAK5_BRALA|nr:Hypp4622 [Branchiostoma lanceolatum]
MTESMCQSDVLHGFAAYRDRELSDNLLQTDDDLDQLHASRARDADAFCGWIPDPRAPPRRLKDGGGPANKPAPKRLRSTKDRRLSQQNLRASYEFRHYRDIGRYIQQYRRDHSCTVAPRDTNPDFTSDALVALLRRADPQKPYLIPRTRVQDIHGGSLEPPKLGVLRRAVTGTSRDWHSFSGSSISRPVTEEALTSSHSPPQLSQQIPARGPERVVAGTGDAGSTTGCGLQFASQSRPSTGTTESRDSGSSSNSNSKSLPNPGTLTLAFSINGNSNNRQQQRPPSNISNRPAKPQYTSIVRSEPSADSKAADAASVSDMSATGINIMAMDRQFDTWQPSPPLPAVPAPRSRSVPAPYRISNQIHPRLRYTIEANRRRATPLHLAPLSPRIHPSVAAREMLDPELRVLRGFAPKMAPGGLQIWHDKKGRGYLSLAAPIRK